jgi:hypothetical protein
MSRKTICAVLIALVTVAPLAADAGKGQNVAGRSSGGKRAAWIAIGAAVGFGAGLLIGLNAFDDAIDSDRKVWTTAIAAAAAGGVAGGLLSRSAGPTAAGGRRAIAKPRVPDVSWQSALRRGSVQAAPKRVLATPEP